MHVFVVVFKITCLAAQKYGRLKFTHYLGKNEKNLLHIFQELKLSSIYIILANFLLDTMYSSCHLGCDVCG
jgi:hypothetical protein